MLINFKAAPAQTLAQASKIKISTRCLISNVVATKAGMYGSVIGQRLMGGMLRGRISVKWQHCKPVSPLVGTDVTVLYCTVL